MATYSVFILLAYFSPKSQGKRKSAMFSTKKIWKVTIFWLGMENGFWFEKTRLHLIANLHYVVLFLFQIHLFILLPNSCIVVSRVGLVSSLGTPIETPTAEDWAYVKRCSLRLCFLIQNYFLFHCINHKTRENGSFSLVIKWSREGARDADSAIRRYRYAFKTISWNTETPRNLTSFV